MDLRCYAEDMRKQMKSSVLSSHIAETKENNNVSDSMISNITMDAQNPNYAHVALEIAVDVFDEYLRRGAKNEVQVDDDIKCHIYTKFGCE
jgi:hypothetical protein